MVVGFLLLLQLSQPGWLEHGLEFLWPTDASRELTSSFMEYRSTHFHYGLDVKTWNKTGYKVFAAERGYISRIRVSPTGYGKVIYLTHPGGFVTVYAHLERFSGTLEKRVIKEQYRLQQNIISLTFKPNEFPVKRGDLIAYSGESGIGTPHLHYEIRDKEDRVINPLFAHAKEVQDQRPPEIKRLALIPLSPETTINGSRLTHRLNSSGTFDPETTPSDIPVISGPFGVLAEGQDYTSNGTNRLGIYETTLMVGDRPVYQSIYDSYPIPLAKFIHVHRDFESIRMGYGRPVRLFPVPDNPVTQPVATDPLSWFNLLEDGLQTVTISMKDFFGNEIRQSQPVLIKRDATLIAGTDPVPIRAQAVLPGLQKENSDADKNGWKVASGSGWVTEKEVDTMEVVSQFDRFRIRLKGSKLANRLMTVTTELNGRYVLPEFSETNEQGIWLWYPIPLGERAISIHTSVYNTTGRVFSAELTAFWIATSDEILLELPTGTDLTIRQNSRFENSWLMIRETGNPQVPESYRIIIGPETVPFLSSLTLRIPVPIPSGWGLINGSGKSVSWEGGSARDGYLVTSIGGAGNYGPAKDSEPPMLSIRRKKNWKPGTLFLVDMDDSLSGIDYSSFRVLINETWCRADLDPERKVAIVHPERIKPSDEYLATIVVRDRQGNETTIRGKL